MTSDMWLQTLFSGAVGSVIGLVGIFIAFKLASRQERRAAREDRTAESVALMVVAANDLADRYVSMRWISMDGALVKFVTTAQLFAARELRDHPDVAWWTIHEAEKLAPLLEGWQKRLPLFTRRETVLKLVEHMGRVTGELVAWIAGRKPDSWFADEVARETAVVDRPGAAEA